MSNISRSAYQKVCEENKRILKDLRTICDGGFEGIMCTIKWRKKFKADDAFIDNIRELFKRNNKIDEQN